MRDGWLRRCWGRCLFLLLAGAVLASAAGVPSAPTTLPSATRGREAVAAYARLVGHLASERMEGRGPGTRGRVLARDFLAGKFRSLGLKPAFGKSYLQPFDIRMGVTIREEKLGFVEPGKKQPLAADAQREFVSMGFSPNGGFEGPAVFVGYGVVNAAKRYDSYGGLAKDALAGKVAVAFRFEPQDEKGRSLWGRTRGRYAMWSRSAGLAKKAQWAAARGASALLVVNPPSHAAARSPGTTSGTAYGPRSQIPVIYLAKGLFRKMLRRSGMSWEQAEAAVKQYQAAADAGTDKPRELGGVVIRGRVELEPKRVTLENVAGVLPGAGRLGKEYLIVGAHYDHLGRGGFGSRSRTGGIHYGADDNASGTAGVVMLAKWYADRAGERGGPGSPAGSRRSIVFAAFDGEERGLLGSRHLAGHLDDMGIKPRQVAAMLNFDMIGRMRDKKLSIWGAASGDRWRQIVDAAVAVSDLDVRVSGSGVGPSDQASFYRQKIPVLSFFTGLHPDYHTPGDTAEKINAAGAVEVLAIADRVLGAVWADADRIVYQPPKRGAARGAMAMATGAYLGVVPEVVSPAGGGCGIAEVVSGGPAAKAGLKPGDVVVAWNDKPVEGMEDLLLGLHGSRAGQQVALKVRRGKETLEVKVKLGKR